MPPTVRIQRSVALPDAVRLARCERLPELGPAILFFSGGTALNPLAEALVRCTHRSTHLVTVFDSGGSSAKLREAFRMPAIGDLRSRLMALADRTVHGQPSIYRLFKDRFPAQADAAELRARLRALERGRDPRMLDIPEPMRQIIRSHLRVFSEHMPADFDLRGASIGNLILVGGYLNNGHDINAVVYLFAKLIAARGVVRPVTDRFFHLAARLRDGRTVVGQHLLTGKEVAPLDSPIRELYLTKSLAGVEPAELDLSPDNDALIRGAELICFPMGSFYSSVCANLLVRGVGRAVHDNDCPKVYVPNAGVDPEEIGTSLYDRVRMLIRLLARDLPHRAPTDRLLQFVLLDSHRRQSLDSREAARIEAMGIRLIDVPLATTDAGGFLDANRVVDVLASMC